MRFYVIKFLLIIMITPFTFKILYSDNINSCMKKAIKLDVELNKILTMCRENIKNIEVYKNSYSKNIIKNTSE